ncbi:hypothetical protein F5Y12DRAFT_730731 [Xylaria sp. FL1777]|nr:hypothetical protein F5Y12DRAFT_730731 [Xylaria sp. FL1777]
MSSGSTGSPSNSSAPNNNLQIPNPLGAHPSNQNDGFARPPPGFDPEQAKGDFLEGHGQGLLDPNDAIDESIEDEIKRKIAELGDAKKSPVTDEEKERIANKIRSLREGGWLDGLKLQLVGKDAVPIEYFNRLAAEHENTILKVAQINAQADREMAKKDAQIKALREKGSGNSGVGSEGDDKSKDDSDLLNNAILNDENNELKEKLANCEQRRSKLESQIQGLTEELQQEKSKPQGNTGTDNAISKYKSRIEELQKQLDSTKADLETARQTLSRRYDEIQTLWQQRMDSRGREQGLKDEVTKLRTENTEVNSLLASLKKKNADLRTTGAGRGQLNDREIEGLRKRIAEIEAGWAKCKEKAKSLENENKNLKDALQSDPNDPDGLRRRILELEAELARRDETIRDLEAQLAQAGNASPPGQNRGPPTELQARCNELRDARDRYRNMWARRAVADRPALIEFWDAVENTNREINQLYRGIDRLGRVLGLSSEVLDTPTILDKIVTQVTSSVVDEHQTPRLAILNLRNANSIAQIRIETLMRELDRAQLGRSEDEIRAQLRVVDHDEVEKRVSARTQAFRDHRRAILAHIFDAHTEFLAFAETSADRVAIEALVDRFLQPTTLPMIQPAQGGAR